MGTGSHLGLSFSELGVLMSTPSSEKDTLLRLPVPVKIAPKFLKKEVFIVTPFILLRISCSSRPLCGCIQKMLMCKYFWLRLYTF